MSRYILNGTDITGLAIPAGGTAGQMLVQQSATDGDVAWESPSDVRDNLSVLENDDIAYAEAGNVATKSGGYKKGELLVVGNNLKRAKADISPNASFTASNIEDARVSEELSSLSQSLDGFKIKEATQSGTANPSDFDDYCITIGVSGGSSTYPLTYGMVLTVKRTRTFQINLNANRAMYRFASADSGGWSNWREFTTTVPST